MARGDLTCPIDGSILGLPGAALKAGTTIAKDTAPGGHVHITMTGTFTCAQGHRFEAKGDFLLERIG